MTTATKGPRTVGPNLAAMTIRERAQMDWEAKKQADRRVAERAAKNLAQKIFGIDPDFVDYVPETYAARKKYQPRELVCFEVEGLVFNYVGGSDGEVFVLVDRCAHCEDGVALLARVARLSDIAYHYECNRDLIDDPTCADCKKAAEDAEESA